MVQRGNFLHHVKRQGDRLGGECPGEIRPGKMSRSRFTHPNLVSSHRKGCSLVIYGTKFAIIKLESLRYHVKLMNPRLLVLTQQQRVTHGETNGHAAYIHA